MSVTHFTADGQKSICNRSSGKSVLTTTVADVSCKWCEAKLNNEPHLVIEALHDNGTAPAREAIKVLWVRGSTRATALEVAQTALMQANDHVAKLKQSVSKLATIKQELKL